MRGTLRPSLLSLSLGFAITVFGLTLAAASTSFSGFQNEDSSAASGHRRTLRSASGKAQEAEAQIASSASTAESATASTSTVASSLPSSSLSTDGAKPATQSSSAEAEYRALAAACSSNWPLLCHWVDELETPSLLDGTTGEVNTLGVYKISQKLHRDIEATTLMGYGSSKETATSPGPTIIAKRGVTTYIQWENHLEDDTYYIQPIFPNQTWATPEHGGIPIVMHLHGGETEPTSDGHFDAWFTQYGETGPTYVKSLYSYHNSQAAATLWYHDHTRGLTRFSSCMGLMGIYIVKDPEGQEAPFLSSLPSGEYDIPLVVGSKVLNESGFIWFTDEKSGASLNEGLLPDGTEYLNITTVNMKANPYKFVDQTQYRFRVLNVQNMIQLYFQFIVVNASEVANDPGNQAPSGTVLPFIQISTDGGYLPYPTKINKVFMGPAERTDVIVDFSTIPAGSHVYMVDLTIDGTAVNQHVVRFIVRDNSLKVSQKLAPLPASLGTILPMPDLANLTEKIFIIKIAFNEPSEEPGTRTGGPAVGTGLYSTLLPYSRTEGYLDTMADVVAEGTQEVWTIVNISPSLHAIHLHAVKLMVISRGGIDPEAYDTDLCAYEGYADISGCTGSELQPPEDYERGWKDTVLVTGFMITRFLVQVATQDGELFPFDPSTKPHYVWHCHMQTHEDYDMTRALVITRNNQTSDASFPGAGLAAMANVAHPISMSQ
eukprot:TRINITY_DN11821_c0_g2_i1.p1 TRINITY_DN11821_c0_g2~~TRINITY_DN11821_c0_g2_i1.p1  ORF type:complete len:740 (+),score=62.31 TRINITY_DN11821_c0_g2_i1:73-2220(+)